MPPKSTAQVRIPRIKIDISVVLDKERHGEGTIMAMDMRLVVRMKLAVGMKLAMGMRMAVDMRMVVDMRLAVGRRGWRRRE